MGIKELCDCLDNLDNFTPETCRFDKEYGQEKERLWDELKGACDNETKSRQSTT